MTTWKGIMKCYPFEEKRLAKWSPPYFVQPKYDGVRCRAVPMDNGEYILLSSEENIIFSVPHINKALKYLYSYQGDLKGKLPELDGELYCHGLPFERIVSITSRTTNLHPDHLQIQLHIFDIVNGYNQIARILEIEELKNKINYVQVAPFWVCSSLDEVLSAYDKIINQGYEGIIVRNQFNHYERKRSNLVMKFKPKKEDTYEIISTVEEMDSGGNPKGSLGSLVCLSGDGNTFNVGTGFTADERQIFWELRETLPGRMVTVKYQHITSGKGVPRFPVFVEVK